MVAPCTVRALAGVAHVQWLRTIAPSAYVCSLTVVVEPALTNLKVVTYFLALEIFLFIANLFFCLHYGLCHLKGTICDSMDGRLASVAQLAWFNCSDIKYSHEETSVHFPEIKYGFDLVTSQLSAKFHII